MFIYYFVRQCLMERITIRLEKEITSRMKLYMGNYYSTKTEFIREAIRDKLMKLENESILRIIQSKITPLRSGSLSSKEREDIFESLIKITDSEILRKYHLEPVSKV